LFMRANLKNGHNTAILPTKTFHGHFDGHKFSRPFSF
jgi:hypothetical protein